MSFGLHRILRYLIKFKMGNSRICLELGSGPGNLTKIVSKRCDYLVTIDFNYTMCKLSKRFSFDSLVAVFEYLPFRNKIFDRIISTYAIHDSMNIYKTVKEISRVITDKGMLLIVDNGNPSKNFERFLVFVYTIKVVPLITKILTIKGTSPWISLRKIYEEVITNQKLKELLIKNGFKIFYFKEIFFKSFLIIFSEKIKENKAFIS